MDNCHVIAITNQKGGVGKTTTTVNLGVGLANSGYRVLLIDADPQGSLTVSLGVKNPDDLDVSLATVMEAVINEKDLTKNAGILYHEEGVDLLPSNIELSGMETGLFNIMSREYVLKDYADTVRKNYDYILIDCMPSLGMMTINALVAADSVIIPSQPSFLSAKGLDLLLRSISKVCSFFKLEDEYPGWTGDEEYGIISELPEQEMLERYPVIMRALSPYIMLRKGYAEIRRESISNGKKFDYRKRNCDCLFSFDDETEYHHLISE